MSELRRAFGRRLFQLRRQKSITQERLAEATGLSTDFVSLMERGINAPSFESIEKLMKALGVEARELFEFDPESSEVGNLGENERQSLQ